MSDEKVFTYPISEKLTEYDVDGLVHYSAYRRAMLIFGKKIDVNVVVYSLSDEEIERIRNIDSEFKIINVEDYLDEINEVIGELFHAKKLKIKKKMMYYCKSCNEFIAPDEVATRDFDLVKTLNKVRIARRTYFVDALPAGVEPVGVAINEKEGLIYARIDKETWISPKKLRHVWIHDLEIPEDNIKVGTIWEIRSKVKFADHVVIGNVETGFITKDDVDTYELKNVIPSYSEIFSLKTHVKRKVCPKCGGIVEEASTPFLVLDSGGKEIKISSVEGGYKIPILYCESCGHMEYGTKIRDCPECGNLMDLKFAYNPVILPVGVYYSEMQESSSVAFLHEKEQRHLILKEMLRGLERDFGKNVIILRHKCDEPGCGTEVLTKLRGKITGECRKIDKMKRILDNLIKYIEIYGACEPKDIIDRWALYRNEEFKRNYLKTISEGNIRHGFDILYDYIVLDISRFYVMMKRKEPILREVIADALRMFHVYAPEFSEDTLKRMGENEMRITLNDFPEVKGIRIVKDVIKRVMEFRNERAIPRREPIKKVVFVSDRAEEIKGHSGRIMKFINALMFQATEKWEEMDMTIEPNLDAINKMYRAWAPKIAFLLRRKNVKEVMDALNKGGYTMGIEGFIIKITPDMVKYVEKVPKGYIKMQSKYGTLYIYSERDITTMRIRMVNEIIRRINSMRRDLELDYDDVIDVSITTDDYILRILKGYGDEIRERTRARNVDFKYIEYAYVVEWPIVDFEVVIGINPLFKKWVIKAFQSIPGIAESKAEMLFHMGYGSIYELMQASPTELSEIPGFSVNFSNKVREYLYSTAFRAKKKNGKEYCPFCEAELAPDDEFCPRCGAPIRVEIQRREIEEGNIYLAIGEFSKVVSTVISNFNDEKKLLITKDDPDTVKKEFNLKNTNILWISYVPMGKSIKPKDTDKLLENIEKNIGKGVKIILMDAFEFMLAINGIEKMLDFLREVREDIKNTNTIFMFNLEEVEDEYMEKIAELVDGKL